jgi:cation:H+ antiporter
MLMALILFVLGVALLSIGAEMLVRGASRLASALGVSSLVIGLTVVSFGTSTPELAVSINASLAGHPNVALGNVVGSNLFNILFILGASALVTPLVVHRQLIKLDVPVMIGVTLLMIVMSWNGFIGRGEGVLLLCLLAAYILFLLRMGRVQPALPDDEYEREFGPPKNNGRAMVFHAVLIVVGLLLLALGTRWFLDGATTMARALGVNEVVIGLTLVAAGTSLPEVATSVMAAWKGERDIAVGNVIGSNIFNVLCVLGAAAAVAPSAMVVDTNLIYVDMPWALVVAVACLPVLITGMIVARWEGAMFMIGYVIYTVYLFSRNGGTQ